MLRLSTAAHFLSSLGEVAHGKQNQIGAQTQAGDVQHCADIPAKGFRNGTEHDDGGIFRPDEEHIDITGRSLPEDQVDAEGDDTEHKKHDSGAAVVLLITPGATG